MSRQNIYDNEIFFEGYRKIRERKNNANVLFELPALFSLLPDMMDKTVLDLGCGFGEHCKAFVSKGAKKVLGIDISKKMLEVAERDNADSKISYLNLPIEEIEQIDGRFDLVVSSLALHYVEDFKGVVAQVYDKLVDDGLFIFSQEHPVNTCHSGGDRWTRDENGGKIHLNVKDYGREGQRESVWFVDGVKRYHRTFSTILNTLVDKGFVIEQVLEPLPTSTFLEEYPEYDDLYHMPHFLLIKARKAR